jgi:glycosyltransferase involved in cell wall biosynthesis
VRVLHITDDLELLGGVQRYLERLLPALRGAGVEVDAWSPSPGPLGGALSRWYGWRHRAELRRLIGRRRPDVVHAHNLWMRLSPAPLGAAAAAGVRVVMTAHDYALVCPRKWMVTGDDRPCESGFGPRCAVAGCRGSREGWAWAPYNALRWLKTWLHRRMLRSRVDRFVSPSRHLAGWLERSLGVGGVAHIVNFAPAAGGEGVREVSHPQTLLYAGRLGREKGVDVLLRAMPGVVASRPEARLVVAGDGPERSRLEAMAGDLGVSGAVRFSGALAADELGRRYEDAGLVVLPTLWMENCPVSVLEAFAHGRGVVATAIGGLPELVDDGHNGALFPRGDVRRLADLLGRLLGDPDRVAAMGRAALDSWRADHTPEIHAGRLVGLYRSLLDRGDGPCC